jgi:hypothetical protein
MRVRPMRWACLFSDGSMNVHSGDEDLQRRRAYEERDLWNKSRGVLPADYAKVVRLQIQNIEEVP